MEKLTAKKRLTVVKQYLSGLSYNEIAAKTGTSKGTVANVVTELKAGVFPEAADITEHIDELRELSLDLKKFKLTPTQCAVGLALLARLNECGLDPGDMDRWPWILKSLKTEDQAQEFVGLIYSIQEVQQGTGLSLPALEKKAHELEKKAYELEPVSAKLDDGKKQLAELKKQREDLTAVVAVLEEKMKWLAPRVQELEKREEKLLKRSEALESKAQTAETAIAAVKGEVQKLQQVGLPFEALAEFNIKVRVVAKRHAMEPAKLRDRLLHELKCLDKGLGLEKLIEGRRQQLKEIEKATAKSKSEMESLKVAVANIQQEKTNLEVSIKAVRDGVSQEIAKIIPIATGTVKQLVQELQHGRNEALVEVRLLRDEAIEVGKEVGQYQAILQVNQWLNELLALVRGEENVEAQRVRVISLSVVRGIAGWLKQHNTNSITIASLSLATDKLIRDLEQWQT